MATAARVDEAIVRCAGTPLPALASPARRRCAGCLSSSRARSSASPTTSTAPSGTLRLNAATRATSSPAMIDCWTPEWNQVLAWAQLGHLVLYLLYFAKHVYNDAATTKRHAD